jgi:gluconolactonase
MTQHPEQPVMEIFCEGAITEPRLLHPECVAVDRDGFVWCGGELGQIYRIAPDGSDRTVVASTGGFCLGMAFDRHGDLFICDLKHAAVFRLATTTGKLERFAEGADGHRMRVPNYPAFDRDGLLYVSDSWSSNEPGPGIFRFRPDGHGELWHPGPFTFANGLAFNSANDVLYVAETRRHAVSAIRLTPDGRPGRRDDFVVLPEMWPDGLAVATDGSVLVACYEPSVIVRVDLDGTWTELARDRSAFVLGHPTNVAFTADALIAANLGRWHLTRIATDLRGLPLPPS